MATASTQTPATRSVAIGIVAGMIAAAFMGMFAMVADAVRDAGFWTPMYHVYSLVDSKAMMTSMEQAKGGDLFYFALGPPLGGVAIHTMTGAAFGGFFGLIARALRMSGGAGLVTGIVYGLAVFAFSSSWVGLPVAAELFNAGKPISDMPEVATWGKFVGEHLVFGFAIGLWPLLRPQDFGVRAERGTYRALRQHPA